MSKQTNSTAELLSMMQTDQDMIETFKADPVRALATVTAPPHSPMVYRIVVSSLGLTVVATVIGAIVLANNGNSVPEILVAIGTASVGALAGLLAPQPQE